MFMHVYIHIYMFNSLCECYATTCVFNPPFETPPNLGNVMSLQVEVRLDPAPSCQEGLDQDHMIIDIENPMSILALAPLSLNIVDGVVELR